MRWYIIREVNGKESEGESITDEAIWQRDAVKGFKQEIDNIFPFFWKVTSAVLKSKDYREARSVFSSWCSSAESSHGGLSQDRCREDGQKSTDLRKMWEDELLDLVMD